MSKVNRSFLAVIAIASFGFSWVGAAPVSLPKGFESEVVAEGIDGATALRITDEGLVYIAEQTGFIRVFEKGEIWDEPVLDISDKVDDYWERGLIGMCFDRNYPKEPYAYVVYVAKEPYTHHVVSRFEVENHRFIRESERVLLAGDDQAEWGGFQPGGHQGGPIVHGPDGKLYIGLGEQTADTPSQRLDALQGKILRINTDGSIPPDNPFFEETHGKYRAIYATGIRNPFGLVFQPDSGRLFDTDVGLTEYEEVNEIFRGANYGWPLVEGPSDDPEFVSPLWAYPPEVGRSICGGAFYPESGSFPEKWKGKLFFIDWIGNWIKALDVDQPEEVLHFGDGFKKGVAIEFGPKGDLWLLLRGTIWRDGQAYAFGSGRLVRIWYSGREYQQERFEFPSRLSSLGLYEKDEGYSSGLHSFEINLPVWLPGISQRNYISIPEGGKIVASNSNDWEFPKDAALIHEFVEFDSGRVIESHVYLSNGDGSYRAAAYRPSGDGEDFQLATTGGVLRYEFNGKSYQWLSPGPILGLEASDGVVGFYPQFNGRQLNAGDQLLDWKENGWFHEGVELEWLNSLPALSHWTDETASVENRVRSYLDANCASCHRAGGVSRGVFDASFTKRLESQNIVEGSLVAGDLGVEGAQLVAPGDPERSILYLRMIRNDTAKMPPVRLHDDTPPIADLMRDWIELLKTNEGAPQID